LVCLVAAALFNRIEPGYISSISFYLILFIPVVSLIHISFSYFIFVLSHNIDRIQVSKGDELIYTIKLINPSFILLVPFSLHFISSKRLFIEAQKEDEKSIIVNHRSRVVIKKKLACAYRGTYTVGVDQIVLKDYFGFFCFNYKDIEQHKILVYPKLRELKSNLLRNTINESSESVISNDAQNMSVFSDVRAYQPGDPLNRIHWKLSAKAGEFVSKDYSGQMTNKTKVFVDTFNMNLDEEMGIVFEDFLVEGCVSNIHFLLENRIDTSLYYEKFGINKLEGMSGNDFPKFYDELAKLSFYHEDHFLTMIDQAIKLEQDKCHLVIMSQNLSLALAERLVKLKYQNYEVSVVLCDEKSMEVDGLTGLGDNKTQFLLSTSKIPIYLMQHNENSTVLGVS